MRSPPSAHRSILSTLGPNSEIPRLASHTFFSWSQTALSHLLSAAAIRLIRLDAFLEGMKATKTRVSRFATLAPDELAGLPMDLPTVSNRG